MPKTQTRKTSKGSTATKAKQPLVTLPAYDWTEINGLLHSDQPDINKSHANNPAKKSKTNAEHAAVPVPSPATGKLQMKNSLEQLEHVIAKGETAAIESGRALRTIRDERLYQPEFTSFESYLSGRWKMSRQRAHQLISLAELSTKVDITGLSERQARPLMNLPPERQPQAVETFKALEASEQTGKAMDRIVKQVICQPVNSQQAEVVEGQFQPDAPRTPIGSYGGKTRLAETITSLMPAHRLYVEPFFGGGSVLFAKQPSKVEIVSDVNHGISNFFSVMRDPEKAKSLQQLLVLTEYGREQHRQCLDPTTTGDVVEDARRFFVRVRQSYSSIEGDVWARCIKTGQPRSTDFANAVDGLMGVAQRLRKVQIESRSFEELMPKCDSPDAIVYCDPPYVHATRSANGSGYRHEMSDADHGRLLDIVKGYRSAKVLLSGYRCDLYDGQLKNWTRYEIPVTVHASGARGSKKAKRMECVWRNF